MSRIPKIPPPSEAGEFMSAADAAKLLFVSRSHVLKQLEQGKLKLHHITGNERFVTKASVLAYQVHQRAVARAYQASAGDDE